MKKFERINGKAEELLRKNEPEKAFKLAKNALAILEDTVGPEHIDVAEQLLFMAELLSYAGEKMLDGELLNAAETTLDTHKMQEVPFLRPVVNKLEVQFTEFRNENGEFTVSLAGYISMAHYAHALTYYERAFSIMVKDKQTKPSDCMGLLRRLHSLYEYFFIDSQYEIFKRLLKFGINYSMAKSFLTFIEKPELYGSVEISTAARNHFDQAETLFEEQRFEDAAEEYKKVLALEPKFAQAYLYLGDCYYNMHQEENALPYFKKAIELDPKNPQALAFLGDVYLRLGDLESAHESYRKSVESDPDYANAEYKLKLTERLLQTVVENSYCANCN